MPVRIVWNDRGFVKIMKSRAMLEKLRREGAALEAAAGPGMESDASRPTSTRARVRVWTETAEGVRREAEDRALSRAAFARAIGHVGR